LAGAEVRDALLDGELTSGWSCRLQDDRAALLTVEFREPVEVETIRLLSGKSLYPFRLRMLGQGEDGAWRAITPPLTFTWYFWSGRRFFGAGAGHRLDVRVEPGRYRAVQLELRGRGFRRDGAQFSAMRFYRPAPASQPDLEDTALARRLAALRPASVFLERGWANRLAAQGLAAAVRPSQDETIWSRRFGDVARDPRVTFPSVPWTPGTVIVLDRREAAAARALLEAHDAEFSEDAVGDWTLLTPAGHGPSNLVWTGFAPFTLSP
jgi:hypothetical protein